MHPRRLSVALQACSQRKEALPLAAQEKSTPLSTRGADQRASTNPDSPAQGKYPWTCSQNGVSHTRRFQSWHCIMQVPVDMV